MAIRVFLLLFREVTRRLIFPGLREIIGIELADAAFATAHAFLGQILDDVDRWEADFVLAARPHAVAVFKPELSQDSNLWDACEDKYGQGLAYKNEIAATLSEWFDNHEELQDDVDHRVQRAWKSSVLKPLRTAAGGDGDEQDGIHP